MRKIAGYSILIATIFWSGAAQSASKGFDEALAITCAFAKAARGGSSELSKVFFDNAYKFPEKQRQSVTLKIRDQLKNHKFERMVAFDLGELDGLVVENLLAMGSQSRGTVYFRLRYEPFDGEMALFHLSYQDKLQKVLADPLMKTPQKLSCPGE